MIGAGVRTAHLCPQVSCAWCPGEGAQQAARCPVERPGSSGVNPPGLEERRLPTIFLSLLLLLFSFVTSWGLFCVT